MSSINRPIYLQYNYTIKPQKKQGLSANFLAKKHTLRTVLLNTSGKVGKEIGLMQFEKGKVVEKEFPFGFTPQDARFTESVAQ